jgi:hypothetical protein
MGPIVQDGQEGSSGVFGERKAANPESLCDCSVRLWTNQAKRQRAERRTSRLVTCIGPKTYSG